MRNLLPRGVLILILGSACLLEPATAETVYLHGGTVLRGKISARDALTLTLEIEQDGGKAVMKIPLARIRRIGPVDETVASMVETGMAHLKAGELDKAAEQFEDAIAQEANAPRALLGRALVTGARGDHAASASQLYRALILVPHDPELRYYHGMALIRTGELERALEAFERALALGPEPALVDKIKLEIGRLKTLAAQPRVDPAQVAARGTFDAELGNNANAAAAGKVCADILRSLTRTIPGFDGDIYVELKAPYGEERLFAAGGDAVRYQTSVAIAQISFLVSPRSWSLLSNREKRQILGSWVRYLKDLYPYATTIAVASDGAGYLAEAVWHDLQDEVEIYWHRSRDAHRE